MPIHFPTSRTGYFSMRCCGWWRASLPVRVRFLIGGVAGVQAGDGCWKNSPIIINRYREATMALGYEG